MSKEELIKQIKLFCPELNSLQIAKIRKLIEEMRV